MRHFISLLDYTHEELTEILDRADYLAGEWKDNKIPKNLINKQVGLWFLVLGISIIAVYRLALENS